MIRLQGGDAFVAPALVEIPLSENHEAFAFAERLCSGEFDMVIFLTGVGTRILRNALEERAAADGFLEALRKVAIVARGPKPSAVLREWQVPIAVLVPEPNTWRELLASVADRTERRVAVQEYGRSNHELLTGLEAQGRTVSRVPVYNWALPQDTEPLAQALAQLLAGKFEAAVFTTGIQIENFLEFAERQGKRDAAVKALRRLFLASIGPTCSESLRACGLTPAMEPSHPKMGILIREAALQFAGKVDGGS